MNRYTATYRNETYILGEMKDGLRYGLNEKGEVRSFDFRTPFTNHTEVRVVPKDGGVWLEGVTAEDIIEIVKVPLKGFGVFNSEAAIKILRQFTRPLPEEPKENSLVKFGNQYAFRVSTGYTHDWVLLKSANRETTSWRLILEYDFNPVIISEGVDK